MIKGRGGWAATLKALLVTVPLRKPSLAHTRTRALALPASCSIGQVRCAAAVSLPDCVHVAPLSLLKFNRDLQRIVIRVGGRPLDGHVPLVKSSPPAGLLIDTTGRCRPR